MGWIRNRRDFYCGILLMLFSVVILVESSHYTMGTAGNLGPAYFPTLLGYALLLLSIIIGVRGVLSKEMKLVENIRLKSLLIIPVSAILYAVLLAPAGMIVAMIVMVVTASLADRDLKPMQIAAAALVLALGSALVFVYFLGQPIPLVGSWFK